jgi:hypothetical protein
MLSDILTACPITGRLIAMPSRKSRKNWTAQEEIASVITWAERMGYADVPAIKGLRQPPTPAAVLAAIQWADSQGFHNVAAALRERGLKL